MSGRIFMTLAISADGYIADVDGGYDWIVGQGDGSLDTEEQDDFAKFVEGMDIVVMGKNCYDQGFAKDYPAKTVYVATHKKQPDEDNIRFINEDIVSLVEQDKAKGKNIFLFGGGILIDGFIKKNVIDKYIIGIIPTILGKGRPLFLGDNPEILLHLEKYFINDGIIILNYTKRK